MRLCKICKIVEIALLGALAKISFDCLTLGEFTVKLSPLERYLEFGAFFVLSVLLIILKIYHMVRQ